MQQSHGLFAIAKLLVPRCHGNSRDGVRQRLSSLDLLATLSQQGHGRNVLVERGRGRDMAADGQSALSCGLMGDVLEDDAVTASASNAVSVSVGLPMTPSSSLNIVIPPCHQMMRI